MKIIAMRQQRAMPAEAGATRPGMRAFPPSRAAPRFSRKQAGNAAIEFAIVFPIFFLIFYAIVTYGLIMVAQQSITLAAEEGARAALRYAATEADRNANAQNAALGAGSVAAWLSSRLDFNGTLLDPCPYAIGDERCYRVTVTYPDYRNNPLIPRLFGPLMNVVIPDQLSSTAVVQID